jgi:hypothetical protein
MKPLQRMLAVTGFVLLSIVVVLSATAMITMATLALFVVLIALAATISLVIVGGSRQPVTVASMLRDGDNR